MTTSKQLPYGHLVPKVPESPGKGTCLKRPQNTETERLELAKVEGIVKLLEENLREAVLQTRIVGSAV